MNLESVAAMYFFSAACISSLLFSLMKYRRCILVKFNNVWWTSWDGVVAFVGSKELTNE